MERFTTDELFLLLDLVKCNLRELYALHRLYPAHLVLVINEQEHLLSKLRSMISSEGGDQE